MNLPEAWGSWSRRNHVEPILQQDGRKSTGITLFYDIFQWLIFGKWWFAWASSVKRMQQHNTSNCDGATSFQKEIYKNIMLILFVGLGFGVAFAIAVVVVSWGFPTTKRSWEGSLVNYVSISNKFHIWLLFYYFFRREGQLILNFGILRSQINCEKN